MKAYQAIVGARFRILLQYRAAAIAGFSTQLFFGIVRIAIFAGFYHSSSASHPMTLSEVVTYTWLGQAMLTMLPYNQDSEIRGMVRSGAVAYELLRPVDLYSLWYCRAIAMRTAPMILRAVPMFIIALLFLGMKPPESAASAGVWIASTVAAVLISCAITTLMSISLMWTISGEGIWRLISVSTWLFCGMLVPLPLFPEWAQRIMYMLPFRGVMDIPFRLYMGSIGLHDAPVLIAQQLMWAVVLILGGRFILSRGLRRLVVQGG